MNIIRAILITFLGNYLINNIVGAVIGIFGIPAGYALYGTYFVVAAIIVLALTHWYLKEGKGERMMDAAVFGVIGFVVAFLTAVFNGVMGILAQTGSFAQLATVGSNLFAAIANVGTLVILCYWIIPPIVYTFIPMGGKRGSSAPRPMI